MFIFRMVFLALKTKIPAMNRGLLFIVIAVTSLGADAQSGNWYIGGVGGYSSDSDNSPSGASQTSNEWLFGPEVGTFLTESVQVGVYLGLYNAHSTDWGGDKYVTTGFSSGLYGRKFFRITDSFSTFAGLYFGYSNNTRTETYASTGNSLEEKQTGFGVKIGVGIAYALSPRFTAMGQLGLLGYTSSSSTLDGVDNGSMAGFQFGINTLGGSWNSNGGGLFNIGLYYTFVKNN